MLNITMPGPIGRFVAPVAFFMLNNWHEALLFIYLFLFK